jgi:hypothetical protein
MLVSHMHVRFLDVERHNVFVIVVNFLSTDWEPNHLIVGLFEAHDMSGATMVVKLK